MADGVLSQEEIDALTKGAAPTAPPAPEEAPQPAADASAASAPEQPAAPPPADVASEDAASGEEVLTDLEKDTLGEIGNISMGSAATALSMLLGHKISITTPSVSIATMDAIKARYPMPYLIVSVGYTTGIDGNNILAIQASDAAVIADLMMGGDGTNVTDELDEMRQSAVSEAMNQMMGSVSTSLSQIFNKKIDISPPKSQFVDMSTADKVTDLWAQDDHVVKISFKMEVENILDSEIMQILPINVAKEMVKNLMQATEEAENAAAAKAQEAPPPAPAAAPTPAPAPQPVPQAAPVPQAPPMPQQAPAGYYAPPPPAYGAPRPASDVPVQAAQFTPLMTGPVPVNDANIGLILDVPLDVSVELGHTKKKIKDILELSSGSVIELDRLAGEPVDILVNGKLLAKGEVVVIDENFGVRITDIVSPEERAKSLQ